jgi:hypothetical protein
MNIRICVSLGFGCFPANSRNDKVLGISHLLGRARKKKVLSFLGLVYWFGVCAESYIAPQQIITT